MIWYSPSLTIYIYYEKEETKWYSLDITCTGQLAWILKTGSWRTIALCSSVCRSRQWSLIVIKVPFLLLLFMEIDGIESRVGGGMMDGEYIAVEQWSVLVFLMMTERVFLCVGVYYWRIHRQNEWTSDCFCEHRLPVPDVCCREMIVHR